MAGSQSGFDMQEYEASLDETTASVMPDTWVGHGRLLIHERDFGDDKKSFAIRLTERLAEKYPDQPAEKLAEKAAEKAEEKLG